MEPIGRSVRNFQNGCARLNFKIERKVGNEAELTELVVNSRQLIGPLRRTENLIRPDVI